MKGDLTQGGVDPATVPELIEVMDGGCEKSAQKLQEAARYFYHTLVQAVPLDCML